MTAAQRFARVLRAPDVARLLGAAILARMPIGIDSLGMVLFVRAETGSFARTPRAGVCNIHGRYVGRCRTPLPRTTARAPTTAINITAPPSGIMAVGGYRFLAQDLQEWARRLGQGALLTALPDRLSGHRIAGRALDNARAREALTELGLNPLMVEAFRDRSGAV